MIMHGEAGGICMKFMAYLFQDFYGEVEDP
jgi:hypothetical protein